MKPVSVYRQSQSFSSLGVWACISVMGWKKALLSQKIPKHGIWNEKPSMALTFIIYYLINFSFPRSQMKKERRHKEKIQKVHDKMLLGQVITIHAINWFSIYPSLGCYRCFIFERISWTISTEWWGPFIWTGNYIYNDDTNGWYLLTKLLPSSYISTFCVVIVYIRDSRRYLIKLD